MKRFYSQVDIGKTGSGYQVKLDGRTVKTPMGHAQIVPTTAVAEALAAEWAAQPDILDTTLFRFRDLADYAIDLVAPEPAPIFARLIAFLDTDTLCYRADPDEPIFKRQLAVWEPVLTAFERRYDVQLERISGIMHRPQPAATIAAVRDQIARFDPFALSELVAKTSLAASLTIGLGAVQPGADIDALWSAANLEEDWQWELWGSDPEAQAVRQRRTADFMNAHAFGQMVRA